MNEKIDLENNIDDELTVIDATIEESRVNVVDSSLGDDDYSDDDIYDGYYDEKVDEPYYVAIKSVVFGSLAIIFPLFAWLFSFFNSMSLIAFAVAVTGLIFAFVGLIASVRSASAPRGSLSQGLSRAGRCIGIIGIVVSSVILAVIFISFIIAIVKLVFVLTVCLTLGLAGLVLLILSAL